jgi:hypothetical protein
MLAVVSEMLHVYPHLVQIKVFLNPILQQV